MSEQYSDAPAPNDADAAPPTDAPAGEGNAPGVADRPADSQPADGGTDQPEGADAYVGFEPGDLKFDLAEGQQVDQAALDEFTSISKEAKIDKGTAQKLADAYAKRRKADAEATMQQWDDTRAQWQREVRADKEIGGDKLDESLGYAQRALSAYGDQDLQTFGEHFGWADNPAYVRFLVKVGKTVSEGQAANGANLQGETVADRWYGKDGQSGEGTQQ